LSKEKTAGRKKRSGLSGPIGLPLVVVVQKFDGIAQRQPAAFDHLGVDAEIGMAESGDQLLHRVGVAFAGIGIDLGRGQREMR